MWRAMDVERCADYRSSRSDSAAGVIHELERCAASMITETRTSQGTVVRVHGELDIATAPLLQEHLMSLVADGHRIVLDLAGVEFMDSSGLEVLEVCHRRAELAGSALVLRRVPHRVTRLLELTGRGSCFPVEAVPLPHPRGGRGDRDDSPAR